MGGDGVIRGGHCSALVLMCWSVLIGPLTQEVWEMPLMLPSSLSFSLFPRSRRCTYIVNYVESITDEYVMLN